MAKNEKKTIDFGKIGKTVEATEIKRNRYTTGGKWKRETIIDFLRWCEKNLPKDKARVLTIDEIFQTFYQTNNELLDDIKSNEKRKLSFVRTFVKTANKIAKEYGIKIHIGTINKFDIKIQKQ